MTNWDLFIGIKGLPGSRKPGAPPSGWWRARAGAVTDGSPPAEATLALSRRSMCGCAKAVSEDGELEFIVTPGGTSFQHPPVFDHPQREDALQ